MWSSSAPVSPAITDSAVSRAASRHRSSNGSCACSGAAGCELPLRTTPYSRVASCGRWCPHSAERCSGAVALELHSQLAADRAVHGYQSPRRLASS